MLKLGVAAEPGKMALMLEGNTAMAELSRIECWSLTHVISVVYYSSQRWWYRIEVEQLLEPSRSKNKIEVKMQVLYKAAA